MNPPNPKRFKQGFEAYIKANEQFTKQTIFTLDLFLKESILRISATSFDLMESDGGKNVAEDDPRSSVWSSGGERYYDDLALRVETHDPGLLKLCQKTVPVVQATTVSKITKSIVWKVQFEGVMFSMTYTPFHYIMDYLTATKLTGPSIPLIPPGVAAARAWKKVRKFHTY